VGGGGFGGGGGVFATPCPLFSYVKMLSLTSSCKEPCRKGAATESERKAAKAVRFSRDKKKDLALCHLRYTGHTRKEKSSVQQRKKRKGGKGARKALSADEKNNRPGFDSHLIVLRRVRR